MRVTITRCDCGCGAVKGEWMVYGGFHSAAGISILVMPWKESMTHSAYKHAAGEECVHKLLSQWMQKQREGK